MPSRPPPPTSTLPGLENTPCLRRFLRAWTERLTRAIYLPPSSFRTFGASFGEISTGRAIFRFRFGDFFSRI